MPTHPHPSVSTKCGFPYSRKTVQYNFETPWVDMARYGSVFFTVVASRVNQNPGQNLSRFSGGHHNVVFSCPGRLFGLLATVLTGNSVFVIFPNPPLPQIQCLLWRRPLESDFTGNVPSVVSHRLCRPEIVWIKGGVGLFTGGVVCTRDFPSTLVKHGGMIVPQRMQTCNPVGQNSVLVFA